MGETILNVVALLVLPTVVFIGGARIMSKLSGRKCVLEQLAKNAAPEDRKPLNQRLRYNLEAVSRHWGVLDEIARTAERRFLVLDLFFPVFYGGALMASLLTAWMIVEEPFAVAYIMVPVAITVLSDWMENLILLTQLDRFGEHAVSGLQAGKIRIASIATVLKLLFFSCSSLVLLGLLAYAMGMSL